MPIDVSTIRPLGERILVRRYEKPEKIGSIILPDEVRADNTMSLWEVVEASAKAKELLGVDLEEDDILQTRPWRGTFLNELEPGDGPRYAFINASEVINIIKW